MAQDVQQDPAAGPAEGSEVVALYFEDRITEARATVGEARAALAAAKAEVARREGERDAFASSGTLPPGPAVQQPVPASLRPEWELCTWALNRVGQVAFTDMSPAGDAVYRQRQAEERAVHAWLTSHGYPLPEPFGETYGPDGRRLPGEHDRGLRWTPDPLAARAAAQALEPSQALAYEEQAAALRAALAPDQFAPQAGLSGGPSTGEQG